MERGAETRRRKKLGGALSSGRRRETDDLARLPREPGLYRHVNKETGATDYIGHSQDLRRRNQEHERLGKLDLDTQFIRYGVAKLDATAKQRQETEKAHISRLPPSGDKAKGGDGRS